MRRAAKIRIAGTLLATATSLLSAGAATSQSQVLNNQVQLGDVFASQTLDVVDVSGQTAVTTPATGNSLTGSAVSTAVDVQSSQGLQGNVSADATLNATVRSGDITILSTSATGNTGDSNAVDQAAITGGWTQDAGTGTVTAFSRYNGPDASTSQLTVSSQAVANSQGYGAVDSTIDATITQTSGATVQADNGVTLGYTDGTAVSSALATANNVTATGTGYSTQTLDVVQGADGPLVQATSFTFAGNAQDITAQATATGNNLSANNEGGVLTVTANQNNSSSIGSEAYLSSFQFGSATANAYGVGNSVLAGNFGPEVVLNNTQLNTGSVNVSGTFIGDNGYDAYLSSTAIGNAVTGFACSECQPTRMTVQNSQVNNAGVGAQGTMQVTGPNRTVNSVTSATGNSATFYVTRPNGP